jgi:hypothetical protein
MYRTISSGRGVFLFTAILAKTKMRHPMLKATAAKTAISEDAFIA